MELVPAERTGRRVRRVGRIAGVALEGADLAALWIGNARRAPHGGNVMGRLDDPASISRGGLRGGVDVLHRDVRDPVGPLPGLRGGVAANHRFEVVASQDHVVGARAHRERCHLPAHHLAVEGLRLPGLVGEVLEPDELSRDWFQIGHAGLLSWQDGLPEPAKFIGPWLVPMLALRSSAGGNAGSSPWPSSAARQ